MENYISIYLVREKYCVHLISFFCFETTSHFPSFCLLYHLYFVSYFYLLLGVSAYSLFIYAVILTVFRHIHNVLSHMPLICSL